MTDSTGIQWTDATWNPVTGCTKVSAGCKHCYAKHQAWPRLTASKGTVYSGRPFENLRCHPERLDQPLRWRKPRRVFVNSMSDLFHEDVPFGFIADTFAVMSVTTRHTYQVLTKRPERMRQFFDWVADDEDRIDPLRVVQPWVPARGGRGGYDNCGPAWPPENVWLGVSVEDQATADERIPVLLDTPAAVRWVSYEPALGPVDWLPWLRPVPMCEHANHDQARGDACCQHPSGLTAECCNPCPVVGHQWGGLNWIVVGGESGPKARPCDVRWARATVEQCTAAGVPVFVKQLGAHVVASYYDEQLQEWYDENGWEWPEPYNWPDMGRFEPGPNSMVRIEHRSRKGADMDEWPADMRVREYPA